MSDSRPDPDLTPAQDDAVRALLASARHTGPTPPEVVARLDATLASLTEERREERVPVVTLASRRRRTAGTLLLAAAAVVVAGVGIGQVLPNDAGDDSAGSATGSTESGLSAQDPSTLAEDRTLGEAPDAGGATKEGDADMRAQESAPTPSNGALADLSSLSSDAALKRQVRGLRRSVTPSPFSADPACPLPGAGRGKLVSVTFDGLPGALIFRAPVDSTQQVDVYLCGQPGAQRSLRLSAP